LAASGIPVGPILGGFTTKLMGAASPGIRQRLADAGITPEALVEMRMSILRQMTTFGLGFISGADAGIGPAKAHGRYAEAVIELGPVTGTVPTLVAASSGAAAAIGLGRSKGRLHRGYDADVLVVRGQIWPPTPLSCRTCGKSCYAAGQCRHHRAVLKRLAGVGRRNLDRTPTDLRSW
jgi:hypothetical protein